MSQRPRKEDHQKGEMEPVNRIRADLASTHASVRVFFALVVASLGAVAFLRLPLTWDGSYYLFNMLSSGGAFTPHQRLINAPLQAPAQLISRFTTDAYVLQVVFGLAYAAVPFLALLACWRIVRTRSPALFVWPAIGIGLLSLPGEANMTSEAMLAVQLAWPIVMAIAVGLPRRAAGYAMACAVAIIFAHPFSIALLGCGAIALFLRGRWRSEEREEMWIWAIGFIFLTAFALLRFLIFRDVYEGGQLSISTLRFQFDAAVAGIPLIALVLGGVLIGLVSAPTWVAESSARLAATVRLLGALAVVAIGTMLAAWAANPLGWARALEFRGLYLFVSLPCMAVAFLEGSRRPSSASKLEKTWPARSMLIVAVAAVMATVLVIQGLAWGGLTARLLSDLRTSSAACVSAKSLTWTEATALHHWAITPLGMVLQGDRPTTLVLEGAGCETANLSTGFPIGDFDRKSWSNHWFNLRVLERLIELERASAS